MDALFDKGYISNPRGRAESVQLTEEGDAKAKALAQQLFGKES